MTRPTVDRIAGLSSDGVAEDMALTFTLDGETFGIEVGHVAEIIDPLPVTGVPNADPSAPALVNVRGSIVPLIDIRRRLGIPPSEPHATSRVLVLNLVIDDEDTKVALVADDVDGIVETPAREIEQVPELGVRWPAEVLRGVVRKNGDLVILLNAETAFPPVAGVEPTSC